jgi:hypothetical protein
VGASVSQNIAGEHCWVYIEVPPGTKMEIPVQPKSHGHLVAFMPTIGRKIMSKKAAEHHHKAAEHHEHAAQHHKEAAKHHEAGKHETAAHHAHLARGHHEHAMHHAAEAAKAHIEDHGKAKPATA